MFVVYFSKIGKYLQIYMYSFLYLKIYNLEPISRYPQIHNICQIKEFGFLFIL